jgi:hypothetical protein
MSLQNLGNIFDHIYEKSTWASESTLPKSGPGSTPNNAKNYVEFVQQIISKYKVKSVIDIGHGDWVMWNNYEFEGTSYTGIEISENIHNYVKPKFTSKNKSFLLKDIIQDQILPEGDLIICKDVLQHLNNDNILSLLKLFSNCPLIIICNDFYTSMKFNEFMRCHLQIRTRLNNLLGFKNPFYFQVRKNNSNIDNGKCRGIDLEQNPYSKMLESYAIISKFDYDGPKRIGLKKRVYLLKKIDKNGPV